MKKKTQPTFYRQKLLLALLHAFGGKLSRLLPVSFESLVISIFSNELIVKFMYISCSFCIYFLSIFNA